ncbi:MULTISPECIES: maleylpyruvate isomerase N-terminal domain-containing protein [unclassified Mesorhizobium]|uniref:maleylpyruvate isomerase N-terminal domain-containing protein n=1 Tax=unclassified Mesorhizobium TaxID=325217 RepID=UPI00112762BD|nr:MULTISPECIES: maleylpyruvate isomerase N-terminal domain-containing protein [unclassified Mesorhizobium]MBZ9973884.1 maleylpyruvate isomerase N-terminal domain-containing protein [Mesorhizobium sp. BR-1-1-10]TPK10124.1 maleylpyruvate isomerase [Mesorhizobium sp. B2-5-7]
MNEAEARAELRARQGAGARYDAPGAPARSLDLARRGTAYFARLVNNLDDEALSGSSRIDEKNRRWLIASIGLQARMLAESVGWARSNTALDILPFHLTVDPAEIDLAATLPAQALRNLLAHSEVHLNVEWRDLTDDGWQLQVRDAVGNSMLITDTPLLRARALWRTALELDAGGRLADIPALLRDAPSA